MQRLIFIFLIAIVSCNSSAQKHLTVGDNIPYFTLKDQEGKDFDVKDYIGKKILVIYFYPKDESSVCTKESCSFRDSYVDFEKAGAIVIGINYGSVESHKAFIQNHQLPFILLSDPDNRVLKLFGVKGKFFLTGRETFVVDKTGKIVFTFDSFTNGSEHSRKALEFIKQMTK
ncbi:MAG TPA: peroxiredoxin [Puia sp.]|nr:peroxiredoxin [Puia sp.]